MFRQKVYWNHFQISSDHIILKTATELRKKCPISVKNLLDLANISKNDGRVAEDPDEEPKYTDEEPDDT